MKDDASVATSLGPADGNGARRLAARERTARRRDPGHRPGDAASEQERDRGCERGADEARRSEPERERSPVGLLARRRAKQHDRLAAALPGGEQEPRAADVDRAACRVIATQAPGGGVRQEQVGLCRREDREALLVRREEAAELVVHALPRVLAALRGDEARLSLEGGDRVRLERASGEQGADDDRDDQRDEERARDAEEQPRAKAHARPWPRNARKSDTVEVHGTTLYPAPRTVRISRGRPSLRRS